MVLATTPVISARITRKVPRTRREDLDEDLLTGGVAIRGVSIAGTEIEVRVWSLLPLS